MSSLNADQSFSKASLARCLIPNDFYLDNGLKDDSYRGEIINQAVSLAHASNDFRPNIVINEISGKSVYSVVDLSQKLVLRKCARNIRVGANVTLKPRSKIIREVRSYLEEGTPYRIYRLDIASFFENCIADEILKDISKYRISIQTQKILKTFLTNFNFQYASGIPRGIEISPILSEVGLIAMDEALRDRDEVFYYSRFVDDIFIVTSSLENKLDFEKYVKRALPKGLSLNYNKTKVLDVAKRSVGGPPDPAPTVASVNYLGYKISVIDSNLYECSSKPSSLKTSEYRKVVIDLTDKKRNRIKQRLSKSFYSFVKNSDFQLLKDRIVFLSSNRNMLNKKNGRSIPTGVYFSHAEVDCPSEALYSVDKYFKSMICSPCGRVGTVLAGKLTADQKKELLKISFLRGFENRIFKKYSPNRLRLIAEIW